jgi:hypothetical protein
MADEQSSKTEEFQHPPTDIGHDAPVGYRMGCSTWGGVLAPGAELPQRRPGSDPRYEDL